jgi:putative redox protein
MADVAARLRWTGEGMVFTGGREGGPEATIDGEGRAATSPVLTLLLALAGCTGSDVVDIAEKMRVRLGSLEIRMEGDRAAEPPRRYRAIRLAYHVGGVQERDRPKILRAVQLSHEKYCSVLHTLRTDLEFRSNVVFE